MKRLAHWLWLPVLLCCAFFLSSPAGAYPLVQEEEPEPSSPVVRTYGGFTVELGKGADVSYAPGVLSIRGGDVAVSGGGDGYRIVLDGDCQLTLLGLDIRARGGAGITVEPGCDPVLLLAPGCRNTVAGDDNFAGIQVSYSNEDLPSLSIDGAGMLMAYGGRNSAGIGGSFYGGVYYGDIYCNGGEIFAYGGSNAAGIGSAVNSLGIRSGFKMEEDTWGVITVTGGSVTARGDGSGAGIGGGNHADSGKIVISGGSVNARGASGIGSGVGSSRIDKKQEKGPGYYTADIRIRGGEIHAQGRSNGAGIGGAMYCDAVVEISGGTVYAAGDGGTLFQHGGAGIGGGFEGHGDVTISGGTVIALGGGAAAGIGSGGAANANPERGTDSRSGTPALSLTRVEITGGAVEADGGARGGAAIGGGVGADKVEITVSGGTVTARGSAGSRDIPRGGAAIGSGYSGLSGSARTQIARYFTMTETGVAVTGGAVNAVGGWGSAAIGSGADNAPAKTITIDGGDITAFSDGTRFALDTRSDTDDGSASSPQEARDIRGVIQGTMVDLYTELGKSDYEGLTLALESKDGAMELTLPEGYRSFARTVPTEKEAVLWRVRAGEEILAPGEEERSISPVLKTGAVFSLSEEDFRDLFFLSPARSIRATVVWDDGNDIEENRPDASLRLLAGETPICSALVPGDAQGDTRTAEWVNVPRYTADGGREAEYAVWVVPMPGYAVTISGEGGDFTVTCFRTPELLDIRGALYWSGDGDPAPPKGVSLALMAGDREYRRIQVLPGEDGSWTYVFEGVTRSLGGEVVEWTLALEGADDYEQRVSGQDIYLTYIVPPAEEEESAGE